MMSKEDQQRVRQTTAVLVYWGRLVLVGVIADVVRSIVISYLLEWGPAREIRTLGAGYVPSNSQFRFSTHWGSDCRLVDAVDALLELPYSPPFGASTGLALRLTWYMEFVPVGNSMLLQSQQRLTRSTCELTIDTDRLVYRRQFPELLSHAGKLKPLPAACHKALLDVKQSRSAKRVEEGNYTFQAVASAPKNQKGNNGVRSTVQGMSGKWDTETPVDISTLGCFPPGWCRGKQARRLACN